MNYQKLNTLSDEDICYIIALERLYHINMDNEMSAMIEISNRKLNFDFDEKIKEIINYLQSQQANDEL